ncbi:HNH endonuclease signature motif containing protein [Pseudomonas sp. S31]|uniref:HNH endonuclease signature motif containing protein n=1 Tax=Pseudomonas sp. S31 TaxID=1564473 RepID=UPI002E2E7A8F|nr:HNH endonuclease signature motif containing protein [Pseudomonas sp. S31]
MTQSQLAKETECTIQPISSRVYYIDRHMNPATFVAHHSIPIHDDGGVYDMENLRTITPSAHHKIHYGDKPLPSSRSSAIILSKSS